MMFPPLTPTTRVFTPGDYANTARRSMGGNMAVSGHTNGIQGQSLRLSFEAARADEVGAIFLHWTASIGTFGLFPLPIEVWSGAEDPAGFTPSGYLWKYADVPQVDEIPCGLHDITLQLELVPINASAGFVEVPDRSVVLRAFVPVVTIIVPPTGLIRVLPPVPVVTGS